MKHKQVALSEEEHLLIINRLHQVLRPFMLRRLKQNVCSNFVLTLTLNLFFPAFQSLEILSYSFCLKSPSQVEAELPKKVEKLLLCEPSVYQKWLTHSLIQSQGIHEEGGKIVKLQVKANETRGDVSVS